MATSVYWTLYKLFNDPPGQQELKCIKCRYATAAASSVVGLIGAYGVKRTMMANIYYGMGFAFLSLAGFGTTAIALRMASDDSDWNELKIRETMERISKERKEFRDQNRVANH